MNEGARLPAIAAFLMRHRSAGLFGPGGTRDSTATPALAEEAARFASDLESLGPTFVKFGQMLSTRPDLVPPAYIEALSRLQDRAAPVPFEAIAQQVEDELGLPIGKVFDQFDPTPLGTASFAQVHAATLRSGRRVAVKVQRPALAEQVEADLVAIERLLAPFAMLTGLGERYGWRDWLDEFRSTVRRELDYVQEVENMRVFARHLADYPRLHVPVPVDDYCTRRVLTMQLAEGIRVTEIPGVLRTEVDLGDLARCLALAYLDQIFIHGLIHADPHPGNMLLARDRTLVLLDFGMVGFVPPRMRDQLLKIVTATIDGRGEQVAETLMHIGTRLDDFDGERLSREIAREVARYSSRAEGATPEGAMLLEMIRIAAAAGLRPPAELAMLGKALLNLESVMAHLAPGVTLWDAFEGHRERLLAERTREGFGLARLAMDAMDAQELVRDAPQRLSVLLRTLAENRLRIHIAGLEEARLIEGIQKIANRITAGVIAAAMIVGAALIMDIPTSRQLLGYPAVAFVMFLIAAALGAGVVLSALIGDRRARPRADRDPL